MTQMEENALVKASNDYFIAPATSVGSAIQRYQDMKDFISKVLKEGVDYGKVPGSEKPALMKPGAEKLGTLFGLSPVFTIIERIEDWNGTEHGGEAFFYYLYKCSLYRGERKVGEGDGSCNSHEKKYRYRWVNEADLPANVDVSKLKTRGGKVSEFQFAIEKAETGGQYGKPAEYWKSFTDAMDNGTATKVKRATKTGKELDAWEIDSLQYQIPNDDVADQVNTLQKMAQKRAFVAAILICTNASEYFTQDIEDFTDAHFVEATVTKKDDIPDHPKSNVWNDMVVADAAKRIGKTAGDARIGLSRSKLLIPGEHDKYAMDWLVKYKEFLSTVDETGKHMKNEDAALASDNEIKVFMAMDSAQVKMDFPDATYTEVE